MIRGDAVNPKKVDDYSAEHAKRLSIRDSYVARGINNKHKENSIEVIKSIKKPSGFFKA